MKVSLHSCLLKSCSAQRLLSEKFLKISVSCQHTHQKMKSKGSYKNLGLVDLVSLLEAAHAYEVKRPYTPECLDQTVQV